MPAFGVYPVADALTEGEQISSTYEGRHLTFLASEINHGNVLAVVTKGYPVIVGERIVGVAFKTEVAGTDLIPIDTEGIWVIDVDASDIDGGSAVAGGDALFINTTTCVVSKHNYSPTYIPFGIALGVITTPGNVERIAVKVHHDAPCELNLIGGVAYMGAINVGGMATLGGGLTAAGTTDLQTVLVHSSLQVAVGGILTFPQTTIATDLPAADPTVAGELWCNAGVVTRSAG